MFSALQEIEHLSSRKPTVLESVTDNIAELLVSPQSNIRSLAHTLLARALKYRPASNANILSAFQRCLDSSRADILMSALEKLPEIVLCMQGKFPFFHFISILVSRYVLRLAFRSRTRFTIDAEGIRIRGKFKCEYYTIYK